MHEAVGFDDPGSLLRHVVVAQHHVRSFEQDLTYSVLVLIHDLNFAAVYYSSDGARFEIPLLRSASRGTSYKRRALSHAVSLKHGDAELLEGS